MESKMAKSVDKIVKGLEKLSNQLQACVVSCGEEMSVQTMNKNKAELAWKAFNLERDRAKRICDKIKELIK